jgi:hypothetical protein
MDGLDTDGRKAKTSQILDDIPTVMAGDLARGSPRIDADKLGRAQRKLSAKSKAKLAAERRQIERAIKRRKMKPKPFIRDKMKWDL